MSDTPRTDLEMVEMITGDGPVKTRTNWVHHTVCRQLECELNNSNDRIRQLIAERDTARLQADQNWNLSREFESLLGTSDITTGVGIVKTLIQASKDNVQLRKQIKEQKSKIKRLEDQLMDAKNEYAVLVADVVLRDDKLERIKRLEEALDCVVASCACLHHPKRYQHKLDEACPVEVLIKKARSAKP